MPTIITHNLARTQEVVDGTVVDGSVDGAGGLVLERRDGAPINVGNVKGPKGFVGPERPHNAGQVALFAGSVAPEGWMLCDGRHLSRTEYAQLYSVIGTRYGTGDGFSTFQVPDFRGRLGVGHDAAQTEFDTVGEFGGQKKVTLTADNLPAHTHGVLGYSGVDDKNFTGNTTRLNASDAFTVYDKPTLATGGGAWHNNLQPYLTINYIISLGVKGPQGGGIAAPRYFTTTDRGTTAQRDAKYAAGVALANQKVVWYNTDLGWKESYYAVSGTSGLTAPGLVTGAVAGWYPILDGPQIELEALAEVTVMTNTIIGGWSIRNVRGGAAWFTLSGTDRVNILKHGRYDARAWTLQQSGANAPDYVLQVLLNGTNTFVNGTGGGAFPRNASLITRAHLEFFDQMIAPNSQVALKMQQGTMAETNQSVHVNGGLPALRGQMVISYVGPPLVAEH